MLSSRGRYAFSPSLTAMFLSIAFFNHNLLAQTPEVGWQAELSNDSQNVSGTITVFDEDTLLVEDFTFNGGGRAVFFYLGEQDRDSDFRSGLQLGENLVGMAFDGTQDPFFVDLPAGETIDGWNAISVWCVPPSVSFGSGTFAAVPEPHIATMLVTLGLVAIGFGRVRPKTV